MRDRILEDLKSAMKAQDKDVLSVIRMVKGAMQMEELNKKGPLTDEEMVTIISKQIKTRKESIVEFEKGNRTDLIEQTKKEIEILSKYMPEQMSEEEILKVIDEVFNIVNPTGIADLGKVMGQISPLVKGKADLGLVNKLIREKLTK